MSDTMRPMFTNEGFAVRACRGHFHVTVGGCDLALPGDPYKTREAALDVALSEAVATVAALTAENEQMTRALVEIASRASHDAIWTAEPRSQMTIRERFVVICDTARAALPSSRETTDG